MQNINNVIHIQERKLKLRLLAESILLGGSVYFLLSIFDLNFSIRLFISLVFFNAWFIYFWIKKPIHPSAIQTLHAQNPNLEHSLSLVNKKDKNLAEELQLDRIENLKLTTNWGALRYSKYLLIAFLSSLSLFFGLKNLKFSQKQNDIISEAKRISSTKSTATFPIYKQSSVHISPPNYTGLPRTESGDLNISAYVGSHATWTVKFENTENLTVKFANQKNQQLNFKNKRNGTYALSETIISSGFYSIKAYYLDSLIYQSDFYRIEAKVDESPKIEPTSKELYKMHFLKDPKTFQISAKISDDFKVKQAYLVATVARGSGENVKFRELKIPISEQNFKSAQIKKTIDLKALKFSPGDELYYYWAAFDNKSPEPNFSKSDTYFVVYKDTAANEDTEISTMAMNIIPEYFRSQRQIIIDTEKLIKKKAKIKKEAFNSESNEIGFDQKILRMRYGQYLGEEFETNIGHSDPGNDADEGNMLKGFMHAHDSEDHEDDQHSAEPEHHHAPDNPMSGDKDPVAALLEDYVHAHDDGELNTYYEQSTKSLLKMALEQMWQAELHLRLYEPEKAIPFENKALEYLKNAQQKSRVYVKKTGFDPPPIKEKEKRLTGELNKFNENQKFEKTLSENQVKTLAAEVLTFLDYNTLSTYQVQKVLLLGQNLGVLISNGPRADLSILGTLQKLANQKSLNNQEKNKAKTVLLHVLGGEKKGETSFKNTTSNPKLKKAFWDAL